MSRKLVNLLFSELLLGLGAMVCHGQRHLKWQAPPIEQLVQPCHPPFAKGRGAKVKVRKVWAAAKAGASCDNLAKAKRCGHGIHQKGKAFWHLAEPSYLPRQLLTLDWCCLRNLTASKSVQLFQRWIVFLKNKKHKYALCCSKAPKKTREPKQIQKTLKKIARV